MLGRRPERPAQSLDADESSTVVERPFAVDVCLGIPPDVSPHYLIYYRTPGATPVYKPFPIPGQPNEAGSSIFIRQTLVNPCGFCTQAIALETVIRG